MRITVLILCSVLATAGKAQTVLIYSDTIGLKTVSDNIYNKPAFSDSLASSYLIVIKKEVKPHYHAVHTEHVMVLDGEGMMKLGDKTFRIKKGDLVYIPKNTVHSVKSTGVDPMRVYSIQSPHFDGKDRIMVEEK